MAGTRGTLVPVTDVTKNQSWRSQSSDPVCVQGRESLTRCRGLSLAGSLTGWPRLSNTCYVPGATLNTLHLLSFILTTTSRGSCYHFTQKRWKQVERGQEHAHSRATGEWRWGSSGPSQIHTPKGNTGQLLGHQHSRPTCIFCFSGLF